MNRKAAFALGLIVGIAAVLVPVLSSNRVASYASRAIYDCGIRIGAGVTQVSISGAHIDGHTYGICFDSGGNGSISGNTIAHIEPAGKY